MTVRGREAGVETWECSEDNGNWVPVLTRPLLSSVSLVPSQTLSLSASVS